MAIYSAYIPNAATGEMTVYQQHIRALLKQDNLREPRKALIEDLKDNIEEARAEGCEIILGADFNCTSQEGGLEGNKWKKWMEGLGI